MADFVARLGSRASVPDEVRSAFGVEEYVALLEGGEDLPLDLRHGRLCSAGLLAVLGRDGATAVGGAQQGAARGRGRDPADDDHALRRRPGRSRPGPAASRAPGPR